MQYTMKLFDKPYRAIKNRKKTIELRLCDEKRKNICEGDIIIFYLYGKMDKFIKTRVIHVYKFASFAELYKNLPLEKCGYSEEELEDANPDDMNIYYSLEEQSKYGVVGIEVEVMSDVTEKVAKSLRNTSK